MCPHTFIRTQQEPIGERSHIITDEEGPFSVAYGMGRARHNDYQISSVDTSALNAHTTAVLEMHTMHTAASITAGRHSSVRTRGLSNLPISVCCSKIMQIASANIDFIAVLFGNPNR